MAQIYTLYPRQVTRQAAVISSLRRRSYELARQWRYTILGALATATILIGLQAIDLSMVRATLDRITAAERARPIMVTLVSEAEVERMLKQKHLQ